MQLQETEARALVQRALEAGMHGDNMSGNSLRLSVIRKDSTEFVAPIVPKFCEKPSEQYVYLDWITGLMYITVTIVCLFSEILCINFPLERRRC